MFIPKVSDGEMSQESAVILIKDAKGTCKNGI